MCGVFLLTGCHSDLFQHIAHKKKSGRLPGDCGGVAPAPLGSCNGSGTNPNTFPASPAAPTNVLAVYNACNADMWLATDASAFGAAPTRAAPVKITAGTTYQIAQTAIASGRLWAKYGCDSTGQNCIVGQEVDPCVKKAGKDIGCQPPIDTGFEIDNSSGTTFYDITMVNGFTGPLKIYTFGSDKATNTGCQGVTTPENLSISAICPTDESLNTPRKAWTKEACAFNPNIVFGDFNSPYYNPFGQTIHLNQPYSLIAKSPINSSVIGCFAPGQKLASVPVWGGLGIAACAGNQCKTNVPPDINSIGGSAQAYDSRIVMYQNPYNACDLTNGTVGDNNNCLNGTKIPVQTAHGPLAQPNDFERYLVDFCTTGTNATTSAYCSDKIAAQGNPVIQLKGSTAASNMGHLGPIVNTKYVNYVHQCIPDTYAWQYDDANALRQCPNTGGAGTFKMVVAFGCPVP